MTSLDIKLLESLIVIIIFVTVKFISNFTVKTASQKFKYQKSRIKITRRILNVIFLLTMVVLFLLIWGVDQSKLFVFLTSFLTILGVAFFAQWSILSNVTSTLILFFNHHIKIGDNISIAEKDTMIEGRISDIGFFFVYIKTKENEEIILPSNLFIQKAIKKNLNT